MFKRFVNLVIAIVFLSNLSVGQSVLIKGEVKGRPFEVVRIITYADNFSSLRKPVASVFTDENGKFSMKINAGQTQYAIVALELSEGGFYLKPGAEYDFTIFPDSLKGVSVFDIPPLAFDLKASDGGLNDKISEFNEVYNGFMEKNFSNGFPLNSKELILSFEDSVKNVFSGFNDEYFKNYVKYTLGQLEWYGKVKGSGTIMKYYFTGKPVVYGNIQYAVFFKEFFKEYFKRYLYGRYYYNFIDAVSKADYGSIDSLFKKDVNFKSHPRLRELVIINSLDILFHDRNFSKQGVLKLLEYLSRSAVYEKHRVIAGNYYKKLGNLLPGTPAPAFSLPLENGKKLDISRLKGKIVVLDFIKADCGYCLSQLDFLNDMQSRLGANVDIVILVYGKDASKVSLLLRKKNIDWPVLFIGKKFDVLDAYGVRVFPTYIIINPDGTIAEAPAPLADEDLEKDLRRIIFKIKMNERK